MPVLSSGIFPGLRGFARAACLIVPLFVFPPAFGFAAQKDVPPIVASTGARKSTPLPAGARKAAAPPAKVRPGVRKDTQKALRQFSPKAFGGSTRPAPPAGAGVYDAAKEHAPGKSAPGNEKITFDAQRKLPAEGIAPRRAPLPGARNTLSHIDGLPPPEVSMRYKMQNGTTARFLVNPQDQNSPIYAPVRPGENVGGAGVYLDMDVRKNLQFQVGGEYRELDDNPGRTPGDSAGASMGFKLNF